MDSEQNKGAKGLTSNYNSAARFLIVFNKSKPLVYNGI